MIDLKELEKNLSDDKVINLLNELGATEYQDNVDAIVFRTICHNHNEDEGSMKLYYYKKNKRFHCYTQCGCNFNIYDLFKKRYELLGIDYNFYKDIVLKIAGDSFHNDFTNNFFEVYQSEYNRYDKQKVDVNIIPINKKILDIFSSFYTPEWLSDGINKDAMKEFDIKYSIPQNKIIIPHYDIDNNLIGIRSRALNKEDIEIGKYMPIQLGDKIYSHPLGYNLYGLNKNKENIAKKKLIFISEGEKSVLQYETMFGRKNNIMCASCGNNFSQYQLYLALRAGAEKIIICYDKEGKTWTEQSKYIDKLKFLCKKYSNKCLIGFIWDTKNLLNLKDSPTDKGKDIFRKLYKEGVVWVK